MLTYTHRTQSIEELEQVLASIAIESTSPSSDVKERKRQLDSASKMFDEVSPAVSKMKKAAEDTNPSTRTYGEQMAEKVLVLCTRFDNLEANRSTIQDEPS
ncbi:hypothetical protein T484DRAFT_1810523 [Baffinella frigidus]|nr:hypothetical protein T484DRAFT_1810523 [Cryptophyta sp. CCMP2293]